MGKKANSYDQFAEDFSQTRKFPWQEWEILLPYFKENQKIIDLGCGNGRALDFFPKNIEYFGIDISKKLLEIARKKYPDKKFVHADMRKIPVEEKTYDLAFSSASFHHLPTLKERKECLKEIHRILKEKGLFFLLVWNLLKNEKYACFKKTASKKDEQEFYIPFGEKKNLRYYHGFNESELRKLLQTENFKILDFKEGRNLVFLCQKII